MKNYILFVDDERSILNAIKRVFRKTSLSVLTTDSVDEALEIIGTKTISVLVSDYTMPGSTGADLLEKAKKIRPEMTRIILSGNGDQEATVESINRGSASRFLAKPWDDEKLVSEITEAVSEWEESVYTNVEKKLLKQDSFIDIVNNKLNATANESMALIYFGLSDIERLQGRISQTNLTEFLGHIVPAPENMEGCVAIGKMDSHRFCALLALTGEPENQVLDFVSRFPGSTVFDKQKVNLQYKAGFVLPSKDDAILSQLLENVTTAYQESCSRNAFAPVRYSSTMDEQKNALNTIENGLDDALKHNEFELYYQPKINAADGSLHGAEALIRWNSKELGLVQPNDFIPLIERDGAIIDIGQWVLSEAARQWVSWYGSAKTDETISVNVSPKQLQDDTFVKRIECVIADTGIDPSNLELEITESLMMEDPWKTISILKDIRALGVRLSIDDFGTGYSSLSHLSLLPVDILKIDRSFITPMSESKESRDLVNNLIKLGHDLGVGIVAEGVEDEGQLKLLREYGCDVIQGYYYSPPVPADDYALLVENYKNAPSISADEKLQAVG